MTAQSINLAYTYPNMSGKRTIIDPFAPDTSSPTKLVRLVALVVRRIDSPGPLYVLLVLATEFQLKKWYQITINYQVVSSFGQKAPKSAH